MCDMVAFIGKADKVDLHSLAMQCSTGGNDDATGVALHTGNKIHVMKESGPPHNLFNDERFSKIYEKVSGGVISGLVHARFATHGEPSDNNNNHPHFSHTGSVLTHKGVITPEKKFDALSVCDSEQILHSLDNKGLVDGIKNLKGRATIFYYPYYMPGKLCIYSNNIKVSVYRNDERKIYQTWGVKADRYLPTDQWVIVDLLTGRERWGKKVFLHTSTVSYQYCVQTSESKYHWSGAVQRQIPLLEGSIVRSESRAIPLIGTMCSLPTSPSSSIPIE